MIVIGSVLAGLGGIGSLVCWVVVLIKMFQNEQPLIGVLGILCSLWAFIWGWMKAGKLALKNIMLLWTVSTIVLLIGYGVVITGAVQTGIQNGTIKVDTTTAP